MILGAVVRYFATTESEILYRIQDTAVFGKIPNTEYRRFNPLVPDAHYSERPDKPFSLQMQQLEVDLK